MCSTYINRTSQQGNICAQIYIIQISVYICLLYMDVCISNCYVCVCKHVYMYFITVAFVQNGSKA